MLRAVYWRRLSNRSLSLSGACLPSATPHANYNVNSKSQPQPLQLTAQRAIHNSRNNEGIMNKTIRIGSLIGRRCVTVTAGSWDSIFGTHYMPRIFTFQVDVVKGFWRWYDACYDVKNVLCRDTNNPLRWMLKWPSPKYYREQVNYQLVFDSLRGIPVMICFFIPGGFVVLGSSIVILPNWVVFPRTFWNREQIKDFVLEQHAQRKKARPTLISLLEQYRRFLG